MLISYTLAYFKQDVVEYVMYVCRPVSSLFYTPLSLFRLDTCNHEGLPCGPHVGCECFDKARHCQRNCPCALTCMFLVGLVYLGI